MKKATYNNVLCNITLSKLCFFNLLSSASQIKTSDTKTSFINSNLIPALFFMVLGCSLTSANVLAVTKGEPTQTKIKSKKSAESKILDKAKSLSRKKPTASIKLANEAMELAISNNNTSVIAKAHTLLGRINKDLNNNNDAFNHFFQASVVYKNKNNQQGYILSSLDYIKLLTIEKRFDEAQRDVEDLLFITQQNQTQWLIGAVLFVKANNFYQNKQYNKAITQYNNASKHFISPDKKIQKKLAETYKMLAQSNKRLKNLKQTVFYYEKALERFTSINDLWNVARTLNTLAEAERYMDNLLVALDYSMRGLELHKQTNDPEGHAKASMGAGIIYRHIGRYEKSLTHLYTAHLYYKSVNNINRIAETSNQLGFIYTRLKQFEQARSFYQLTIDMPEDQIKQKTLASALREMAVVYLASKDFESAMKMVQRAYKIYQKRGETLKSSNTTRVIANIYRDKRDDANAIVYYRKSLLLAEQSGSAIAQIRAILPLTGMLMDIDIEETTQLLKKSLALSTQLDDKIFTLYTYEKLRQAEKIRGNLEDSLYYAEQEIKLNEFIQDEKDKNELNLAKANLYSHKMEIELESLREKTILNQLELAKKSNELEISKQIKIITDLQLTKNKYANTTLALLLAISALLVVFTYRRFIVSKRQNRELDYLAARDPLTNCYNRRVLIDRMDNDFKNPELLDEYCVIMADIDNFKNVNDNHGHNTGDTVICGVANILQSCVRQQDIVSRFGGEEFCIILHRVPQNQAMNIAETMRKKVEEAVFDNIKTTCSFGITSIQFNAKTSAELIHQADLALYKSKSLGRNRITLWDDALEKRNVNIT